MVSSGKPLQSFTAAVNGAPQVRDLGYAVAARATALSVNLAKRGYAAYSGNSIEESIATALQQYFVLKMDFSAVSGPIKTTVTDVTFTKLVPPPHHTTP